MTSGLKNTHNSS